jgi:hypothetical protein
VLKGRGCHSSQRKTVDMKNDVQGWMTADQWFTKSKWHRSKKAVRNFAFSCSGLSLFKGEKLLVYASGERNPEQLLLAPAVLEGVTTLMSPYADFTAGEEFDHHCIEPFQMFWLGSMAVWEQVCMACWPAFYFAELIGVEQSHGHAMDEIATRICQSVGAKPDPVAVVDGGAGQKVEVKGHPAWALVGAYHLIANCMDASVRNGERASIVYPYDAKRTIVPISSKTMH